MSALEALFWTQLCLLGAGSAYLAALIMGVAPAPWVKPYHGTRRAGYHRPTWTASPTYAACGTAPLWPDGSALIQRTAPGASSYRRLATLAGSRLAKAHYSAARRTAALTRPHDSETPS